MVRSIIVKFNEYNTISTDGKLSLESKLSQGDLKSEKNQEDLVSINYQKNPLLENKIERIEIELPPKGSPIGITLKRYKYHNFPYIVQSTQGSVFYKAVKLELRRNTISSMYPEKGLYKNMITSFRRSKVKLSRK